MHDEATGRIIIGNSRTEFSNRNGAHVLSDFAMTVEIEHGRERLTFDNWIGQRGDFKSGYKNPAEYRALQLNLVA